MPKRPNPMATGPRSGSAQPGSLPAPGPRSTRGSARVSACGSARRVAGARVLALALGCWAASAVGGPSLWGYGVKPCGAYVAAAPGEGVPDAVGGADYTRYREWLAGLVSGLNLATGRDVLAGADLEAALSRIRAYCRDRPDEDFFNSSMALIRSLGQVKGAGKGPRD